MTQGKGGTKATCPTCDEPGLLLWYAAGSLGAEDRSLVQRSLEECAVCRLEARDNERLGQAVRLASLPREAREALEERAPSELVALAAGSHEQIESAGLSEADGALVAILRKVDGGDRADILPGWGARLQRGWDSLFEGGTWGWLRSPAVAYLLLAGLAYPAFVGITTGRSGGPQVLDAPQSADTGARAGGEAVLSIGDDRGTVLTVFVPVDERYRYRLEIRDQSGRVRFVDEDVKSFDGVGTLAIFVPQGFLHGAAYEVRVTELVRNDSASEIQVFRYPFRIQ